MAEMDIGEIMKYLPHRSPMLLIDRVVEFQHGESLVAVKNVSYNEPYFQGHFPNRPVMPAVIILEAMAQATGILVLRSMDKLPNEKSIYYFVGIECHVAEIWQCLALTLRSFTLFWFVIWGFWKW